MKIRLIENPDDDLREAVNYQLRTHNQLSNPIYWQKTGEDKYNEEELKLFTFDEKGQVIGGLFGSTRFSWLKVDIMATQKALRNQGIGKKLLEKAEEIAKERGCKYVYIDTMEYQAPAFYKKCGYKLVGQLDDWDSHGHKKSFFVKDLR